MHIASHGQFSGTLENTFVLMFNDKLTMDRLEQLIALTTVGDKQPLDLLTLSACETAVGDDRAALGLAGVALKAGAKTALASLWKVDDEATPAVVIEFYRQLQTPGMTKAKALQTAQNLILTDDNYARYRHPYFCPRLC
ncbi:protein conserved in bacteria [Beggiatoa sp. PS]|nr:protein conserved in bacteria [Beggiatoa sp. PS]